jgi:hypothetical protein
MSWWPSWTWTSAAYTVRHVTDLVAPQLCVSSCVRTCAQAAWLVDRMQKKCANNAFVLVFRCLLVSNTCLHPCWDSFSHTAKKNNRWAPDDSAESCPIEQLCVQNDVETLLRFVASRLVQYFPQKKNLKRPTLQICTVTRNQKSRKQKKILPLKHKCVHACYLL